MRPPTYEDSLCPAPVPRGLPPKSCASEQRRDSASGPLAGKLRNQSQFHISNQWDQTLLGDFFKVW